MIPTRPARRRPRAAPASRGRARAAGGATRAQRRRPVADAGRLRAVGVAEEGDDPRLVVGDPLRDDVAERRAARRRVLREAQRGVARGPAALVLQRLRQVPVVERRDRLDPAREQPLGEVAVEAQPRRVHRRRGRWAARAARRSRSGRSPGRARPSGRGRPPSGGSGRRRRRRCRRWRPRRASGRSGPRSTRRARRRAVAPSIWKAAVAAPKRTLLASGSTGPSPSNFGAVKSIVVIPSPLPPVRPRTSHRWVAKKAIMTGSVDTTPAAMSCP